MEDLFDTIVSMSDARARRIQRASKKETPLAEYALKEALGADLFTEMTASSRDWLDLDHAIAARSTRESVTDEFEYEDDWHNARGEDDDSTGGRLYEEDDS